MTVEGFTITMEVCGVGFNERLGVKTRCGLGERRHLSQDRDKPVHHVGEGCIWAERQLC